MRAVNHVEVLQNHVSIRTRLLSRVMLGRAGLFVFAHQVSIRTRLLSRVMRAGGGLGASLK